MWVWVPVHRLGKDIWCPTQLLSASYFPEAEFLTKSEARLVASKPQRPTFLSLGTTVLGL